MEHLPPRPQCPHWDVSFHPHDTVLLDVTNQTGCTVPPWPCTQWSVCVSAPGACGRPVGSSPHWAAAGATSAAAEKGCSAATTASCAGLPGCVSPPEATREALTGWYHKSATLCLFLFTPCKTDPLGKNEFSELVHSPFVLRTRLVNL